jgi:hypothetical protein
VCVLCLCRRVTHAVTLLPGPAGTESEADSCGPHAALEEEDGEDDAEGETEPRADEHGREAAVPLVVNVSMCFCVPSRNNNNGSGTAQSSAVLSGDRGWSCGPDMSYLLVEEGLAHGAGGARDGRNGLGGTVGHCCGMARGNWRQEEGTGVCRRRC